MRKGFVSIMSAQFFSALADNALLIVAIALLKHKHVAESMIPYLKFSFTTSYVVLAAFVGLIADAFLKGKVMFATNLIKILGCILLLTNINPFIAYGLIGLGAAAYSPAKYGILTELLPKEQLIIANSWIEGLTVGAIILGAVLGGVLVSPYMGNLGAPTLPYLDASILIVLSLYIVAAIINLFIPDTGARYAKQSHNLVAIFKQFILANKTLWSDFQGSISLSVTTLFWGAGACLQFIVLWWAADNLGLSLSMGAILQGLVGLGVAFGSILAAKKTQLETSFKVLPYGVYMGVLVIFMALINKAWLPESWLLIPLFITAYKIVAFILLFMIGMMAGYFVVPMNALLQYRGCQLLSAGQSIAIQNFNENLSILIMIYLLTQLKGYLSTYEIVILFGLFVVVTMLLIIKRSKTQPQQTIQL